MNTFKVTPDGERVVYSGNFDLEARDDLYSVDVSTPGVATRLSIDLPVDLANFSPYGVSHFEITDDSSRVAYGINTRESSEFKQAIYAHQLGSNVQSSLLFERSGFGDVINPSDFAVLRGQNAIVYEDETNPAAGLSVVDIAGAPQTYDINLPGHDTLIPSFNESYLALESGGVLYHTVIADRSEQPIIVHAEFKNGAVTRTIVSDPHYRQAGFDDEHFNVSPDHQYLTVASNDRISNPSYATQSILIRPLSDLSSGFVLSTGRSTGPDETSQPVNVLYSLDSFWVYYYAVDLEQNDKFFARRRTDGSGVQERVATSSFDAPLRITRGQNLIPFIDQSGEYFVFIDEDGLLGSPRFSLMRMAVDGSMTATKLNNEQTEFPGVRELVSFKNSSEVLYISHEGLFRTSIAEIEDPTLLIPGDVFTSTSIYWEVSSDDQWIVFGFDDDRDSRMSGLMAVSTDGGEIIDLIGDSDISSVFRDFTITSDNLVIFEGTTSTGAAVFATSIPEPSCLALLGLSWLMVTRRRQRS
ncbi:MAG: hypothetical protein AAGI37_08990 [Planctomycetota bacterium]